MIAYNKDLIPNGGIECADYKALNDRIATAPSALTIEGRAFQAAAVMYHLYYRLNDHEQAHNPTWFMLKGIAGEANQSVKAPSDVEIR